MVGHSKWLQVQHIKGPLGVNRGAAFRKLVKEITVTACFGGSEPSGKPRLHAATVTLSAENPPGERAERAIKKAAHDHKNRPSADQRTVFSMNHGSLPAFDGVLSPFLRERMLTLPRSRCDERRCLESADGVS